MEHSIRKQVRIAWEGQGKVNMFVHNRNEAVVGVVSRYSCDMVTVETEFGDHQVFYHDITSIHLVGSTNKPKQSDVAKERWEFEFDGNNCYLKQKGDENRDAMATMYRCSKEQMAVMISATQMLEALESYFGHNAGDGLEQFREKARAAINKARGASKDGTGMV